MARSRGRGAKPVRRFEHHAHNRIVHVPDDGAIVYEKDIGDAAEAFERLAFVRANRFIAQVAAGGDDGKFEFGHQQMMQRRVRQHRAEIWIAGSDGIYDLRFDDLRFFRAGRWVIRANGGVALQGRNFAFGLHAFQRRKHEREGFFLAMLSFAQEPDGLVVARIHHQMKPAQSFDGDDFSFTNGFSGGEQSIVAARYGFWLCRRDACATLPKFQPRAADRTRIRLRVEAAVARVVVFGLALRTHA